MPLHIARATLPPFALQKPTLRPPPVYVYLERVEEDLLVRRLLEGQSIAGLGRRLLLVTPGLGQLFEVVPPVPKVLDLSFEHEVRALALPADGNRTQQHQHLHRLDESPFMSPLVHKKTHAPAVAAQRLHGGGGVASPCRRKKGPPSCRPCPCAAPQPWPWPSCTPSGCSP